MKQLLILSFFIVLFIGCEKEIPCETVLTGIVVNTETGEPQKDVLIDFRDGAYINGKENAVPNVYTDAEGRFEMKADLRLSTWDVKVERKGFRSELVQVSTEICGEADTRIELEPYALVHVITYDEPDKYVDKLIVRGNVGLVAEGVVKTSEITLGQSTTVAIRSGIKGEVAIIENNYGSEALIKKFNLNGGKMDTVRIGM